MLSVKSNFTKTVEHRLKVMKMHFNFKDFTKWKYRIVRALREAISHQGNSGIGLPTAPCSGSEIHEVSELRQVCDM